MIPVPRRLRRRLLAIAGVFLVVSCCLGIEWWWSRPKGIPRQACERLRAGMAFAAGQQMELSQLTSEWSETVDAGECTQTYFQPQDFYSDSQRARRFALVVIPKGDWIRRADVSSQAAVQALPRGKRAYAAVFETEAQIYPGETIEVYATELVLSGVLVLQSRREPQRNRLHLVLALSPPEIRLLEKAGQTGKLSIALIHANDALASPSGVKKPRLRREKRARIWHED
jgi:Flp pilus assembly protein CpaB